MLLAHLSHAYLVLLDGRPTKIFIIHATGDVLSLNDEAIGDTSTHSVTVPRSYTNHRNIMHPHIRYIYIVRLRHRLMLNTLHLLPCSSAPSPPPPDAENPKHATVVAE